MEVEGPESLRYFETFIEDLYEITHSSIRYAVPIISEGSINLDSKGRLVFGSISRGVICLDSMKLLCEEGRFLEAHILMRHLTEIWTCLMYVGNNSKFAEYEYRSLYEEQKAFDSFASKCKGNIPESAAQHAEERARELELERQKLGKSVWGRLPKMKDVPRIPPVRCILGEDNPFYHVGYNIPSALAVHAKFSTGWNDMYTFLTRRPYFRVDDVVRLLNNAIFTQVALTAHGFDHYRDDRVLSSVREMLLNDMLISLEKRTFDYKGAWNRMRRIIGSGRGPQPAPQ